MSDRRPQRVRKAIRALMEEKDINYTKALRLWESLSLGEQEALIEKSRKETP